MIKIHFSHNYLKITGHEQNEDAIKLVCCAVSAISNTGINCFYPKDVYVVSRNGFLEAKLINENYKNKIMWEMLINQLYFLYQEYKSVILWKKMENDDE